MSPHLEKPSYFGWLGNQPGTPPALKGHTLPLSWVPDCFLPTLANSSVQRHEEWFSNHLLLHSAFYFTAIHLLNVREVTEPLLCSWHCCGYKTNSCLTWLSKVKRDSGHMEHTMNSELSPEVRTWNTLETGSAWGISRCLVWEEPQKQGQCGQTLNDSVCGLHCTHRPSSKIHAQYESLWVGSSMKLGALWDHLTRYTRVEQHW